MTLRQCLPLGVKQTRSAKQPTFRALFHAWRAAFDAAIADPNLSRGGIEPRKIWVARGRKPGFVSVTRQNEVGFSYFNNCSMVPICWRFGFVIVPSGKI